MPNSGTNDSKVNNSGNDNSAVAIATRSQQHAADPYRSIWVSANAGTGKTRVLTYRILRLLLAGAGVPDILAVTYTRAAASEMRDRLYKILARWAVMTGSELDEAISNVGIEHPTQQHRKRARRLFATLLDKPVGLRIETLHAFAQSVLRRFPVEAGIHPHFDIASDIQKIALKQASIATMLASPDEVVKTALVNISLFHGEVELMKLVPTLFDERHLLRQVSTRPIEVKRKLFEGLGLGAYVDTNPDVVRDNLLDAFIADADAETLGRVAQALSKSDKTTDNGKAEKIQRWLDSDNVIKKQKFDEYVSAFLTSGGEVFKKLATKSVCEAFPDIIDLMGAEAMRALTLCQQFHALDTATQTAHLFTIAEAMAQHYKSAKKKADLLDHDDLITTTLALLEQDGGASWVRYKLDKGIKHLLIDEAQDTNPDQWAILSAFAKDFFDSPDEQAGQVPPQDALPEGSIFSVGDFKQSIYSFHGAAPRLFSEKAEEFDALAKAVHKPFEQVALETSFRSVAPVLSLVKEMDFQGLETTPEHLLSREGQGGFVEILDLVETDNGGLALAKAIAAIIKSWIGKRELPARGRTVRAGDIVILVRKRAGIARHLDREIRLAGLPLAGADRVKFNDDIAVNDLLALGRVMLLPEDDLTLAAVLKSPLFGLSEADIFALAYDRGYKNVFQRLAMLSKQNEAIGKAHERFTSLLGLAETLPPHDFYGRVLDTETRKAFAKRLGNHVSDIFTEFLRVAREYEDTTSASLLGFLEVIEKSDFEITRENDNRDDEIRIMTVHGAKGLESPIVILPDTMNDPRPRGFVNLEHEGQLMPILSASGHAAKHPAIEAAKAKAKEQSDEEGDRLLYVALTRAEDGLFIAGFKNPRGGNPEERWYGKISRGINALNPEKVSAPEGLGIDEYKLRRITCPQTAEPKDDVRQARDDTDFDMPSWLDTPCGVEAPVARTLYPSRLDLAPLASIDSKSGEEESGSPKAASPIGSERRQAQLRGSLIHRMLEILPPLSGDTRMRAARRLIDAASPSLGDDVVRGALAEVDALLENADFAPIFGSETRAEVPISAMIGTTVVSGIIDRLLVSEDTIKIVDFKTGRPPKSVAHIPKDYIIQMALYRHVLGLIWPSRAIQAGLIYTENASVHWLDGVEWDKMLELAMGESVDTPMDNPS